MGSFAYAAHNTRRGFAAAGAHIHTSVVECRRQFRANRVLRSGSARLRIACASRNFCPAKKSLFRQHSLCVRHKQKKVASVFFYRNLFLTEKAKRRLNTFMLFAFNTIRHV